MQSAQEIALTPALSPEEREKLSCTARHSLISDSFQRGQTRFPLLWERDRVRASVFSKLKFAEYKVQSVGDMPGFRCPLIPHWTAILKKFAREGFTVIIQRNEKIRPAHFRHGCLLPADFRHGGAGI